MGAKLLSEIMKAKFHEIMSNFKRASAKSGITFDYDIFIETYIKCDKVLTNKELTEDKMIQYFWVAFINNMKKDLKIKSKYPSVDLEEAAEVLDEPYDDRRTIVYETIIDFVKTNFKENEFKAWYLHFAENKSYEELVKMGYENMNFHNIFRNINSHIKYKLPKENKKYKSIVKEMFKK